MVQKTANITRRCEGTKCPKQSHRNGEIASSSRFAGLLAMTIVAVLFIASLVYAESSVNLPPHHWAYDALETLVRAKLTDSCGLSTKPITRMDAARLTQIAIGRIQNEKENISPFNETKIKRTEDALDKLIAEFRPELVELGVSTVAIDDKPVEDFRFRLADPIYSENIYADLRHTNDLLYENHRGLRLKDGFNWRTRAAMWAEYKGFIAIELEPVAHFAKDTEDFDVETGYIKLSYWNVELQAGRDVMWWGPAYHGSMLLSDNAYPLDMIKLKSAHPFMLPWDKLGKWNIDFFVGELDRHRDYSHARLGGLRLECTPMNRLTLGFSRTAIFGGKGRPHLGFNDYWNIFWARGELNQDTSKNASDQLSSVDFKLNIFDDFQVYGEWAGEDKFAPWENESPGFIAGAFISNILNIQDLDFRTEYARNDAAWYTHGIYTTGYRYKGNIMGHHMGGDAEDLFMRLTRSFSSDGALFENFVLGGQLDYETHGRSMAYPEHRYQGQIDSEFLLSESRSAKLIYRHEQYSNFTNISGSKTHNNIFEAEANIKF